MDPDHIPAPIGAPAPPDHADGALEAAGSATVRPGGVPTDGAARNTSANGAPGDASANGAHAEGTPPDGAPPDSTPPETVPPDLRGRSSRWVLEWLAVIVAAVLLAVGVRTYVAQMFYIPSGSMLPTLQIGDRIVVDKLAYRFGSVHRGDIVVFARPPLVEADYTDLVKRVIGLPGETIGTANGHITIDGKTLDEPWLPRPLPQTDPSAVPQAFSLTHPYTVPAGHYFVMGDNRPDSEDSRYFGPIPANLIVGKMAVRVWPLGKAVWVTALAVIAVLVLIGLWVTLRRRPRAGPGDAGPAPGPPI